MIQTDNILDVVENTHIIIVFIQTKTRMEVKPSM